MKWFQFDRDHDWWLLTIGRIKIRYWQGDDCDGGLLTMRFNKRKERK